MDLDIVIKKIDESNSLDFGTIFSSSIELFKKVWVQGFITILLMFVLIIPFYILMYIPMIAAGITNPEMFDQGDPNPMILLPMILIMPMVFTGMIAVGIALNASFLRICKLKDLEEKGNDEYFYFLKKKYLKKIIVLALITLGLSLAGMLLCGIGIIYFMVPISLFAAFFAFNDNLSPTDIVKVSFQLGNKNWLTIFGLLFVMGILAELGFLLCFIGVLFTAMLAKIPVYYVYKNSIGFEEENRLLGYDEK